jgi:hypothetical protein
MLERAEAMNVKSVRGWLVVLASLSLLSACVRIESPQPSLSPSAPPSPTLAPTSAVTSPGPDAPTQTATTSASSALPSGFSTKPQSGGSTPSPPSLLRAIRAGRHAGFDRVVFEFEGPEPAYDVRYVRRVVEDPSGRLLALGGDAKLLVVLRGATLNTTPQVGDPSAAESYGGPRRLQPDLQNVQEIAAAGDFEGVLSFGVGVADRTPFRVLSLTTPARVVIDVATT